VGLRENQGAIGKFFLKSIVENLHGYFYNLRTIKQLFAIVTLKKFDGVEESSEASIVVHLVG
jgi:hypothetical protein